MEKYVFPKIEGNIEIVLRDDRVITAADPHEFR